MLQYKKPALLFFIFLLFFIVVPSTYAATYYVDQTGGNDSNNGTTEGTAWKTINKVNTSTFQPGDNILFKRGEVWREMLVPPSSGTAGNPITFGAYGSGDNPKIKTTDAYSLWWEYSLLPNGGHEIFTGTANDGVSDTFYDATAITDTTANQVEAVTDAYAQQYAVKVNKTTTGASTSALIRRDMVVLPNTQYYFEIYGKRNSGSHPCRVEIRDQTNSQWLYENGTWGANTDNEVIYPTSLRTTESSYTKKSISFTTQSNTTTLRIQFSVKFNESASCNWDAAYLIAGNAKSSTTVWTGRINGLATNFGILDDGVRMPKHRNTVTVPVLSMTNTYTYHPTNTSYFYYRNDSGFPTNTEVGRRLYAIDINARHYIIVNNIDVEGPGGRSDSNSADDTRLIFMHGSSTNITIQNLTVTNSSWYGMDTLNNSSNIVYDNITSYGNHTMGMYNSANGGTVKNSTVFQNGKVITDWSDRGGIGVNNGANVTVMDNIIYDNGPDLNTDFELVGAPLSGPVYFLRNHVHTCGAGCVQIAEGGNGSVIAYNVIDGFGSATTNEPSAPYAKYSGIRIGGGVAGSPNISIYNNVISNGVTPAGSGTTAGIGITHLEAVGTKIRNNIFYNNASPDIMVNTIVTDTSTHQYTNNVFYRSSYTNAWNWKGTNYSSLAAWQTASGQDGNSLTVNPEFVDGDAGNYRLQNTSPLINAGVDVGQTQDYFGTSVPQEGAPDIGVYEKQAPPATPTPTSIPTPTATAVSPTPGAQVQNTRTNKPAQRASNCPEHFKYCSDIGPNSKQTSSGFITGTGETGEVQVYIPKAATPHDLHIEFKKVNILDMFSNPKEIVPFPWMQGYNTAGEIYQINVLSAFNGYPIIDFNAPGVVIVPFDPDVLASRKIATDRLRIAVFNTSTRKWEILKENTVVNWSNHTLANISQRYGYFAVVYKR